MNRKLIHEAIVTLEKADIGSEGLDLIVHKVTGIKLKNVLDSGGCYSEKTIHFTSSLDATENVLLDGWVWESMQQNDDGYWDCWASLDWGWPKVDSYKESLPIARTIVWLKSLICGDR